ncbi:MAG: hypothetical protein ABIP53_09425 [Candidatus Limnocylindrales bacterium]
MIESLPRTLSPGLAVVLVATLTEAVDDMTPPTRTIIPVALLVARPSGIERIEVDLGADRSAVGSAWTDLIESELDALADRAFGEIVLDERSARLTVWSVRWPLRSQLGADDPPKGETIQSRTIEIPIAHRPNLTIHR